MRRLLGLFVGLSAMVANAAAAPAPLKSVPAMPDVHAERVAVLGAARAGERIVTVGDFGTVTLVERDKPLRQARSVPVNATLNAVSFVDAGHGWAVGHWGSILFSGDGGETWTSQRLEMAADRPLFSVHFVDRKRGVAVGLWSLLLRTEDGGANWTPVNLPKPPDGSRADRNLFSVFGAPDGRLYIAAERGTVLRSDDVGKSWVYLDTGYAGSLWTGLVLADGTLVVAGLRGSLFRSRDRGKTWQAARTGTKSSLTALAEVGGRLYAVGLDGVSLVSDDGGASFSATQREDKLALTAVVAGIDGQPAVFSKRGRVAPVGR